MAFFELLRHHIPILKKIVYSREIMIERCRFYCCDEERMQYNISKSGHNPSKETPAILENGDLLIFTIFPMVAYGSFRRNWECCSRDNFCDKTVGMVLFCS